MTTATIRLTSPKQHSGVIQPVGTQLTLPAEIAARYVTDGAAVYVTPADLPSDAGVPVLGKTNRLTGKIEFSAGGVDDVFAKSLFSVATSGADLTGARDATTEVRSMLDASGECYIPSGVRLLIDALDMPPGTKIHGPGVIVYKKTSSPSDVTISMLSGCTIDGVTFQPELAESIPRVVVRATGDNITISNNKFLSGFYSPSFVGYETWIKIELGAKYATVIGNRSSAGSIFLLGNGLSYGKFTDNIIVSPARAMQFYGGKYNTVSRNKIYGRNKHYAGDTGSDPQATVAGINFLTFGFLGTNRGIVGNIITDNEVYGVAEEAIGLDTHGNNANDAAEVGVLPVGTVASVAPSGNGNQIITLQEATLRDSGSISNGWANAAYVIALTGDAVGFIAPVVDSTASVIANTATLKIPRNMGDVALSPGDKILITYGIIGNVISNNIVRNSTSGISLWGSSWYNQVTGNNIEAISTGVQMASVVSATIPGLNENGTMKSGVCGYSGACTISGNVIRLSYESQPSGNARGVSPIVVGTWAYGTPAVAAQNPLMNVSSNMISSPKHTLVGSSRGTVDAGPSTVTAAVVCGNRLIGGGGVSLNRTDKCVIGPNYSGTGREDYRLSASAGNTSVTVAA